MHDTLTEVRAPSRRPGWPAIAGLVLAAGAFAFLAAILFGPGRGARQDLSDVNREIVVTRELITEQVGLSEDLLGEAQRSREIGEHAAAVADQQLAISGGLLTLAQANDGRVAEMVRIATETSEALARVEQVAGELLARGVSLDQRTAELLAIAEQLRAILAPLQTLFEALGIPAPAGG